MADKENNIISVPFTYNVPDDYLHLTTDLGKTGEWTYNGPDKIWVFVDKETNKLSGRHPLTEKEDGEHYPTPLDQIKVMVDCNSDPLMCTILQAHEVQDYSELEQHVEELPCGNTYSRPKTPPPDHTYEYTDIEYDPIVGYFREPLTFKKPHISWDDIRNWRNERLLAHDHKAPADAPQSVKDMWEAHRNALRDLPQVHGASNTHIEIDLTAAAPINTAGQSTLKLTTVTGINVGDDVGVKEKLAENIFEDHSRVVSINRRNKTILLDKNLVATPTDANKELAFSPCPLTAAWKIVPPEAPGEGWRPAPK